MLYGQLKQGSRSFCEQKKRFRDRRKSIIRKYNKLEDPESNKATWQPTCAHEMSYVEAEYDSIQLSDTNTSMKQCSAHFQIPHTSVHFMAENSTHALVSTATVDSHSTTKKTSFAMNVIQHCIAERNLRISGNK